mgnify:CR=1 FL=1
MNNETNTMQAKEFKVGLIGPSKSRKTAFVNALLFGTNINTNYPPTLGVEVYNFDFKYNNNKYRLNLWDCAGNENYQGLGKDYLKDSDLIVIFKHLSIPHNTYYDWIPKNTSHLCVDMWDDNVVSTTLNQIREILMNKNI